MSESLEDILMMELMSFEHRPLDFVYWAFPWEEEDGELSQHDGPDAWQIQLLSDLQNDIVSLDHAIQIAVKSGHNVGKSALLCWLLLWALSTKIGTRGRCTANTEKQLRTVLWAELAKWHRLFIAKQFFEWSATTLRSIDPAHRDTWRIDAMPWSKENPTAFAGLHNYGGRIIIIYDEACEIIDEIWEVTDGVMREKQTELIWVACSQPKLNIGRFYDCFHRFEDEWRTYTVDARASKFTNRESLDKTVANWGEDSDYIRVRVKGEFPNASLTQLFPTLLIQAAQSRPATSQIWDPLILGVDVARAGDSESVAVFRRGNDCRSIPVQRWRGRNSENPTAQNADRIASLIATHKPDAVFIDETGYGGGVVDFCRRIGMTVIGVNFGSASSTRPDGALCANKRAEMYMSLLLAMREGLAIPNSPDLHDQLIAIEYFEKEKAGIQLMSKEDMRAAGVPSPDFADALVLTFAYPVSASRTAGLHNQPFSRAQRQDYDPLSFDRLDEVRAHNSNAIPPRYPPMVH